MATRAQNKKSSFGSSNAAGGPGASQSGADASHSLKLSIDLLAVKDFKMAINLVCTYQLKLSSGLHSFRSEFPSPVAQSQECRLESGFTSYTFNASKTQLYQILASNSLKISLRNSHPETGNEQEVGQAILELREVLSAPLKQSASAMVRVAD